MKTPLIVVVGPTAVGKTALGITLAQAFDGEIISGDSQQVYKELAIGTAKASSDEQAQAKHHLIDVRHVWESYSAYDFVQEAQAAIRAIDQRGKLPIIVGGTGLYIQSLLEGYHLGGDNDHTQVLAYRQELELLSDQELAEQVAEAGLTVKEANRRRLMRALEIHRFGHQKDNQETNYDALIIGLTSERAYLYDRINHRVDLMLEQGLLEEVRFLYDHYPQAQAAKGIGYKELFPYLSGEMPLDQAVELLKRNSRRFAKRQLTWFRNRMKVDFFDSQDPQLVEKVSQKIKDFLLNYPS